MNWLKEIFGLAQRDRKIAELERALVTARNTEEELGRFRPSCIAPPATVEWTADNALALRKFFADETGRKLIELCGGHALQEAMKEAQGDRATPKAAGMDALLRFQFNLASDEEYNRISRAAGDQAADPVDGEQDDAAATARRSF